jgi:photosystem II stability/assembly factor-like uncharacterized protein
MPEETGYLNMRGTISLKSLRCALRVFVSAVLFSGCIFSTLFAHAAGQPSGWVSLGPYGGDVRSLAFDPRNPDRIFLGTSAGQLYVSSDSGVSWSRLARLGAGSDYVLDNIAFDPENPGTIYVAAWSVERNHGGLFRSRDGGGSWQTVPLMTGKSIRALAIAPSNSRILVVGALDGVFRSDDSGDNWRRISPEGHAEIKNIESVAIDPRSPDVIYAGTWHLPWKTSDGGANWQSIKNGIIDDSDVFSIIVDRSNPSVVYASACSGIYKSTTAGQLFQKVQGIPASARRTRVLQQDPINASVVYAGTTEGLWKSSDAGATWIRPTPANYIVNDVLIDPRRSEHVLIATDRAGVLASNDGAQTLQPSSRGFAHRQASALLVDRSDPNRFYVGLLNDKEFGGVYTSPDAGGHWQQISDGLSGRDIFALQQGRNGDLLAGTNQGFFRLANHAATQPARWLPSNLVLTEKLPPSTPRAPATAKLQRAAAARTPPAAKRQWIKSQLQGRVFRMAGAANAWFAATSSGLFRTLDEGASWMPAAREQPALNGSVIGVDALENTVLAATYSSAYLSTDGGNIWKSCALPKFSGVLSSVAVSPGALWVVAGDGAYLSRDGGGSWSHVITGLPARNLQYVSYDPAEKRVVGVAAGTGEVFVSPEGSTWNLIADSGEPIQRVAFPGGGILALTPFNGVIFRHAGSPTELLQGGGGLSQ